MIHVIFNNDYDGHFAAYAAWKYFQGQGWLDHTQFTPVKYGDPFPLDMESLHPEDQVYVFSFFYERELMDALKEKVRHLLFINHLESAVEKYNGASYAIIEPGMSSGARTWVHFFPNKRLPPLGQYISDRKLWKQRHVQTPQLIAFLNYAQMGQDWDKWDDLTHNPESMEIALKNGRLLLRNQDRMVENYIKTPGVVLVQHGHLIKNHSDQNTTYAIYNGGTPYISETAQAVMKEYNVDYTIDWHADMARDVVVFNIRSKDGEKFSAKEYAEKNGGAGQPDSAGFTLPLMEGFRLAGLLGR